MIDWVIKDAEIVDGTGAPSFTGDIAISGDRIVALGKAQNLDAKRLIKADGRIACPGFIDMHSHGDLELLKPIPPDAKIRQGITTELLGQDGLGTAPVKESDIDVLSQLLGGIDGMLPKERWTWRSFGSYLKALQKGGLPNNVPCWSPMDLFA